MERKPSSWQAVALRDAEQIVDWYIAEAGDAVAARFMDALNETIASISEFPGLGSRRYAEQLGFDNLRFREIADFPYLIFYLDHESHVMIWRMLHRDRDLAIRLA